MGYTEDEVLAAARQAYKHGQAEFPVEAQRTALLVIDMQDEFLSDRNGARTGSRERPGSPRAWPA